MSTKDVFIPINEGHAIVEAVAFFHMRSPDADDPELDAFFQPTFIESIKEEFAEQFQQSREIKAVKFIADDKSREFTQMPSGIRMIRMNINGDTSWVISVSPNTISVHCLEYTRWAKVWAETNDIFNRLFKHIGSTPAAVSSVGLKYVDRFRFQGSVKNYDASKLFKKNSEFLHKKAFSSSNKWHCHTGWFDQQIWDSPVLSQLNIDSGQNIADGKPVSVVTIDHTLTVRAVDSGSDLTHLFPKPTRSKSRLGSLMNDLHFANKELLLDLLTTSMAKRIGLQKVEL